MDFEDILGAGWSCDRPFNIDCGFQLWPSSSQLVFLEKIWHVPVFFDSSQIVVLGNNVCLFCYKVVIWEKTTGSMPLLDHLYSFRLCFTIVILVIWQQQIFQFVHKMLNILAFNVVVCQSRFLLSLFYHEFLLRSIIDA